MDRIGKIREIVEGIMEHDDPTHGMDHVMRVYRLAVAIAKEEKQADMEVVQIAALCHDLGAAEEDADSTGKTDHAAVSAEMAGPILEDTELSPEKIRHVQDCIFSHLSRNGSNPKTLEAKILFDANALESFEAMKAAKIVLGEHKGEIRRRPGDIDAYVKGGAKKGILVSDKTKRDADPSKRISADGLYTDTAKRMAKERIEYYKKFFGAQSL